ncbi:hypothetical protein EJ05DRAFT_535057 [Pseudovirgaria hyperparasitica]|uniref:Zn(2)-C6 fungal-type domain-containing protein n=1 Tax=Pseudovirgaria hyperparasitica TaxID=470096 RepID=A0A6A6WHW9_9PEZI|nr:uncharacterized protein EJ05DRAFT_535057 [Pseudovirgaria hyperparasitica]KAF2761695.1 hypothetical protein EJ05DRAFT_535057 [Pseudovirgaria hyperparasitica]
MEPSLTPDEERHASRVSKACQRCRSLKARCLPSDQEGICQRCYKSRRECVWTDAQQRVRKARAPSRISQVEQKIDGLVARITERNVAEYPSPAATSSGEPSTPAALRPDRTPVLQASRTLRHARNESENDKGSEPPISLPDLSNMHSFGISADVPKPTNPHAKMPRKQDDRLRQGILAHADAEMLLEEYRAMAPSFPFVPVSSSVSIEDLRSQKPMLLFAIMTAASRKNRALQQVLEKRFRQEIALRTIVQPAKDITLLQSILVYLAWYHYYLDYALENGATIPHLCMSLTIELRLDPGFSAHMLGGSKGMPLTKSGAELREEQRTLLGCYFLCSIIASGYQRPNTFKRSRYMFESAQELSADKELEADHLLAPLVESRHIDDEIYAAFHGETPLPSDQIATQVYAWQTKLQAWKTELQHTNHRLLSLTIHPIEANLSLALLHSHSDPTPTLQACKSHLDTLLSTPAESYPLLSYPEWTTLPHTIMTLATLCIPSSTHPPDWLAAQAHDRVRLDLYLEALCFRAQSCSVYCPPDRPDVDYWAALKTVLVAVGRWYKKMVDAAGARDVPFRCPGRFMAGRVAARASSQHVNAGDALADTHPGLSMHDADLFADMDLWIDSGDFLGLGDVI